MRYFVVFFKVVMMSLPSVGTVVRLKSQATNLYARGSGIVNLRQAKVQMCGLSQQAIRSFGIQRLFNHLAGKDAWGRDVIGLYPIRKDNTCSFLCTDFDDKSCEHGYKNDVLAFVNVCKTWNVPCYIERSRSGNGAHAWIFLIHQ